MKFKNKNFKNSTVKRLALPFVLLFKLIAVIGLSVFLATTSHAEIAKVQFPTEDGLKLNARIYSPKGASSAPAILLVEGSGKSHFEEELESSPFFQLAEHLSKHGFVAMTFSKRGSASNAKNGSWAKSSFWTDNANWRSICR